MKEKFIDTSDNDIIFSNVIKGGPGSGRTPEGVTTTGIQYGESQRSYDLRQKAIETKREHDKARDKYSRIKNNPKTSDKDKISAGERYHAALNNYTNALNAHTESVNSEYQSKLNAEKSESKKEFEDKAMKFEDREMSFEDYINQLPHPLNNVFDYLAVRKSDDTEFNDDALLENIDSFAESVVKALGDFPIAPRDTKWDNNSEDKKWRDYCEANDGPNSEYATGFLYVNPDEEDVFAGYKFLIVGIIDGKPFINQQAVISSAGILNGAMGGAKIPQEDQDAMKRKISALYARMNRELETELEAPWNKTEKSEEISLIRKIAEKLGIVEKKETINNEESKFLGVSLIEKAEKKLSREYLESMVNKLKSDWPALHNAMLNSARSQAGGKSKGRLVEPLNDIEKKVVTKLGEDDLSGLSDTELNQLWNLLERYYETDESEESPALQLAESVSEEMEGRGIDLQPTRIGKLSLFRALGNGLNDTQKSVIKFADVDPNKVFISVDKSSGKDQAALITIENEEITHYLLGSENCAAHLASINKSAIIIDDELEMYIGSPVNKEDLKDKLNLWFDKIEKGTEISDVSVENIINNETEKSEITLSLISGEKDLVQKSEEKQIITGVVMEPDTTDSQGEICDAETIEKAAHKFMEDYQAIDLQHNDKTHKGVKVIESYIAPENFEINGEKVKKNSWIMSVHVIDKSLWNAVKEGKYTGFSIGGLALREAVA